MRINTNVSSIYAQRMSRSFSDEVSSSTKNLSSGKRVNSAADDSASQFRIVRSEAQLRSGAQAQRNAGDAISMLQMVEGNFSEASQIIIRLRELALQASSGIYGEDDRGIVSIEFRQQKDELRRILSSSSVLLKGYGVGTATQMENQIHGVAPRSLDFIVNSAMDKGTEKITYEPTKLLISHEDLSISGMNVDTLEGARNVISRIDQDLDKITSSRSYLGALQTRLQSAAETLSVKNTNDSSSLSVIRDADYAYESARNLKAKLLHSASTNVIAQSNVSHSHVLKLLE